MISQNSEGRALLLLMPQRKLLQGVFMGAVTVRGVVIGERSATLQAAGTQRPQC